MLPMGGMLLPRALKAVAGDAPVLIAGGIRPGTDVLKAMALTGCRTLVDALGVVCSSICQISPKTSDECEA
jgi:isopentenyl diphosphate isomerase/L-lactate dehydrogenase-like FMN-dependent dehydrogenase